LRTNREQNPAITVRIETSFYEVTPRNKEFVWTGASDSLNPNDVDKVIAGLVKLVVQRLEKEGKTSESLLAVNIAFSVPPDRHATGTFARCKRNLQNIGCVNSVDGRHTAHLPTRAENDSHLTVPPFR
jgi:hypothetical protein